MAFNVIYQRQKWPEEMLYLDLANICNVAAAGSWLALAGLCQLSMKIITWPMAENVSWRKPVS